MLNFPKTIYTDNASLALYPEEEKTYNNKL